MGRWSYEKYSKNVLEVLVAYRAIHLQAYRLRKTTKNLGIFGIQADTQTRRTQLQSSRKPGLHGT
jgi:hypothetical protein